jgi:hypothetical protein
MDSKRPLMSTAEVVFDHWLRRTHGDAFAADHYRGDASGYHNRNLKQRRRR